MGTDILISQRICNSLEILRTYFKDFSYNLDTEKYMPAMCDSWFRKAAT